MVNAADMNGPPNHTESGYNFPLSDGIELCGTEVVIFYVLFL